MIIKMETRTREDAEGNITTDTTETSYIKDSEPDYIKLYTKTWCEFNQIPNAYRELFLQLAMRMTYCSASDLKHSQLVYTGKPFCNEIMQELHWKENMYRKGLKALTEAGAIKRIARGVYQINPSYAGRGAWKYNPTLKQGGVKDLIATFDFKHGTVDTTIVWSDDKRIAKTQSFKPEQQEAEA